MRRTTLVNLYILFAGIVSGSCAKETNYNKRTVLVDVIHADIPKVSSTFDTIQIQASSQAPNGCYSDFHFKFKRESDFKYELTAYATFESNGTCPAVMTGKDTTLIFVPEKRGIYVFKINDMPLKVRTDSVTVN